MPDVSIFSNVDSVAAADAYIEAVRTDPSCSRWLCEALTTALARDPVDAANDADALSMILEMRAKAMLHEASRKR